MSAKVTTWFAGCCLVFSISCFASIKNQQKGGSPGGAEVTPPPVCFQGMVKILAGEFMMGCSPGDEECVASGKPAHKVWLSEYWMDTTEVTVAAYRKCVEAGRCSAPTTYIKGNECNWDAAGNEQHPVNCLDWSQAKEYCEWAVKRLPTEAEWEKAARGGTTSERYSDLDQVAWYGDESGSTHPVGQKKPNAFGLYDMLGNVWEWCSDWYGEGY